MKLELIFIKFNLWHNIIFCLGYSVQRFNKCYPPCTLIYWCAIFFKEQLSCSKWRRLAFLKVQLMEKLTVKSNIKDELKIVPSVGIQIILLQVHLKVHFYLKPLNYQFNVLCFNSYSNSQIHLGVRFSTLILGNGVAL